MILAGGCAIVCLAVSLTAIAAAGAPGSAVILQAAAFAVGGVLALVIVRARPSPAVTWLFIVLALAGTAATLLRPEVDGARRWLTTGPVVWQPGVLTGAAVIWALFRRGFDGASALAAAVFVGIAALQPDLALASALAAALALGLLIERRRAARLWTLLALLVSLAGVAVAAWRPVGLAPVPWVETLIQTLWRSEPVLAAACGAALIAVAAPFLPLIRRRPETAAVFGFWAGLAAANLTGDYPLPVIGYGASAVLGWWISAALCLRARAGDVHA